MAEEYMKGRNFITSTKMNYFHYFLKQLTGNLVHPSIQLNDEQLRIADMGTQTAIWAIDVAEEYGKRGEVDAFDISDKFIPPAAWLPANLNVRLHDITKPFPEDLCGKFQLVNFRLFVTLSPEKLGTMVTTAMTLLKPGGYIQWIEHDKTNLAPISANPDRSTEAVEALIELEKKPFPDYNAAWIDDISRQFAAKGLHVVCEERIKTRKSMVTQMHELHLLAMTDISPGLSQAADDFKAKYMDDLAEDAENGVSSVDGFIVVVGRKPH